MRRPTIVLAAVFLVVLGLLAAVVYDRSQQSDSPSTSRVTPFPTDLGPGPQTPPSDTPTPGAGYPERSIGQLGAQVTTVTGRGPADVAYRRLPGNGTAVHFECPRCGPDTWLVETSRPWPLSGGPLPTPRNYTYMADTVDLVDRNSLLVKADRDAAWTLELTPFDGLPLQTRTVTGRDGVVLRLQLAGPAELTCGAAAWAKTFSRPPGQTDYDTDFVMATDGPETSKIPAPDGTDQLVATIDCPGPWTLAFT